MERPRQACWLRCAPSRKGWVLAVSVALGGALAPLHGQQQTTSTWPDMPVMETLRKPEDVVTFFPPVPPSYGAPISAQPLETLSEPVSPDAPEELADYVGECFYPMLGTRLHSGGLGRRMQSRIDVFHARRAAVLNELLDELVALHNANAEDRVARLRVLAARQAPEIEALESEAEAIRVALLPGSVLYHNADWNAQRRWKLRETEFPRLFVHKEAEFQVLRAAAYFQDELSAVQRGLVREMAMEHQLRARAARGARPPAGDDPRAFFFSPETARFRLPKGLPTDLIAKIAQYNGTKDELKRELLDTIVTHDTSPKARRNTAFQDLRQRQSTRVEQLEQCAEEIRLLLASQPDPPPPRLPPITPDLRARVHAYNRDRLDFIAEFNQHVRNAQVELPEGEAALEPAAQRATARERRIEARRAAARGFEEQNQERFEALRVRHAGIMSELATIAAGLKDEETGRTMTVDDLMRAYHIAMERFDAYGREAGMYVNYKTAMLQPGLSPAQRRLLFGAVLVGLAQPLPHGEPRPIGTKLKVRS